MYTRFAQISRVEIDTGYVFPPEDIQLIAYSQGKDWGLGVRLDSESQFDETCQSGAKGSYALVVVGTREDGTEDPPPFNR